MMPTSGFFRLPAADELHRAGGYTLLEIIVVVALMGLLTGIAVPRMASMYQSAQWAGERDDMLRAISGLGFTAYREARELVLAQYPAPEGQEPPPFEISEGWRIETSEPIRYSAEGVCSGGRLGLSKDGRSIILDLAPPLCVPRIP